jgi:hypothetical protein
MADQDRVRRLLVTVITFSILAVAPLTAQTTDCSKCKVTEQAMDGYHIDQTACPGANAVVCDYNYTKKVKAECQANGMELLGCKPASKDSTYTATKYAANTCGTATKDAQGNIISTSCGTASGATMQITRTEAYCKGLSWDPTIILAMDRVFNVSIDLRDGRTQLTAGTTTPLQSTVIGVPSALISRALAEARLKSVNGSTQFTITLAPEGPTRFSLPVQVASPAIVEGNATVIAAQVRSGTLAVTLSLPTANLGAFEQYAVDLAGLKVQTGPAISAAEAAADGASFPGGADTLTALVDVVGSDGVLAGGAKAIASLTGTCGTVMPAVHKLPMGPN